ncbi:DUF4330 domain-containing protein [Natronomonas halophila]|uniref:DUF4330 family protein n=1 Tax=Natronomonas halophila TaxID=2747817 RepID=UPI0015B3C336|nr:DUF4330 family protein [Natronomonas halophila]QLD86848.1 DUF4330 domain-containing protein [Natronomonas halophila]
MELIDEQGRLFGRVNIVDVLVVVFALAIVVAGAALVFGGTDNRDSTRDAEAPEKQTLHVTAVATGNAAVQFDPTEIDVDGTSASITDVHRTPAQRVYFRIALDGVETEEGFRFGGNSVRVGDRFTISDNTTRTAAFIIERGTSSSFDNRTTTATLAATIRTPVADAISEGDQQFVGDMPVATITGVDRTAVNETHTRLRVRVDFETRVVEGTPYYGGAPIRLGQTIHVRTSDYEFEADVIERE